MHWRNDVILPRICIIRSLGGRTQGLGQEITLLLHDFLDTNCSSLFSPCSNPETKFTNDLLLRKPSLLLWAIYSCAFVWFSPQHLVFQTLGFLQHSLADFFFVYGWHKTWTLFRRFRRVLTVDRLAHRCQQLLKYQYSIRSAQLWVVLCNTPIENRIYCHGFVKVLQGLFYFISSEFAMQTFPFKDMEVICSKGLSFGLHLCCAYFIILLIFALLPVWAYSQYLKNY